MKKILAVISNNEQRKRIKECFESCGCFSGIRFSESGNEALEVIREFMPDIVLCALNLPDGDGIWLSERLKEEYLEMDISLFVISDIKSQTVKKLLYDKGISYVFDESEDISKIIKKIKKLTEKHKKIDWNMENKKEISSTEKRIDDVFKDIGISERTNGYKYLKYAVLKVIEDKNLLNSMTKELYPMIGTVYKTKWSNVERVMRHTISHILTKENNEKIIKNFGADAFSPEKKMSNSEFIARTADIVCK